MAGTSSPLKELGLQDVREAAERLAGVLQRTPVVRCRALDARVGGHRVFLKAECLQHTGAFKARGAYNALAHLLQQQAVARVCTYSSGNHGQALAWAASRLGVEAVVFTMRGASAVKVAAARAYGAKVVVCAGRAEIEAQAHAYQAKGAVLIPPYDYDDVICGQGTAVLEALEQVSGVDAVFAPCGGGGLLSGTVIAARGMDAKVRVFGAEPLQANDAVRSLRDGSIFSWPSAPPTIADGARTLSVTPRTLKYLQRLDDLWEISEEDILHWTQWLRHLTKLRCEPTAALGMVACQRWLAQQDGRKTVVVILSGGNIDAAGEREIWAQDRLTPDSPSV